MFKNEFRFHVEPQTDGAEIWDVLLLDFMSNYKNISFDVDNENNLKKTNQKKPDCRNSSTNPIKSV